MDKDIKTDAQRLPAVAGQVEQPVRPVGRKPAPLSGGQLAVLRLACTHGHLTQGCRSQRDYGYLKRTLCALRKRGLLDVMDKPTEAGLGLFARIERA